MNRVFFTIAALVSICFIFPSCEKSTSDQEIQSIVDPSIIGSWVVTKYEALDIQMEPIKSTDDETVIRDTYWKFEFSTNSTMNLWYGSASTPTYVIPFFYSSGYLFFGETGSAEVESLTDNDMVFISNSFMPSGWEKDLTIKAVRTTCKK